MLEHSERWRPERVPGTLRTVTCARVALALPSCGALVQPAAAERTSCTFKQAQRRAAAQEQKIGRPTVAADLRLIYERARGLQMQLASTRCCSGGSAYVAADGYSGV